MFAADGLADADGFHGSVVDAAGEIEINEAVLSKLPLQHFQGALSEGIPVVNAQCVHLFGRDGPHSPESFDGQMPDKLFGLVGMNGAESVGLPVVGGYLCQKFVVGHPG